VRCPVIEADMGYSEGSTGGVVFILGVPATGSKVLGGAVLQLHIH
jgi:hypothetical protein